MHLYDVAERIVQNWPRKISKLSLDIRKAKNRRGSVKTVIAAAETRRGDLEDANATH
jgi:hypothetical protein